MLAEDLQRQGQDVLLRQLSDHAGAPHAERGRHRRADGGAAPRRLLRACRARLLDPVTRQPYPNNQIPAAQLSPISQSILEKVPTARRAATRSSRPRRITTTTISSSSASITRSPANNRITGRYWNSYAETPAFLNPANYLEVTVGRTWLNRSTSITDTQVFGANLTNQLFFSFNRTDGNNVPAFPDQQHRGAREQVLQRRQAAMARHGHGLLRHAEYRRHEPVPARRVPVRRYRALDQGPSSTHARRRVRLRHRRCREQLHRQRPVELQRSGAVHRRRLGGLSDRPLQHAASRNRRVSPNALPSLQPVRAGFLEGAPRVSTSISACASSRSSLTGRWTAKLAAWRPGQRSTRYVNAPSGVRVPGRRWRSRGRLRRRHGQLRSASGLRVGRFRRRQNCRSRRLRRVLRPAEHNHHEQPVEPGAVRHAGHDQRQRCRTASPIRGRARRIRSPAPPLRRAMLRSRPTPTRKYSLRTSATATSKAGI